MSPYRFHKWWQRYLESGPEGLYDLTRCHCQVVNQTPPHIERAVISIRRRLTARATLQTRYSHIGAAQIRAELESLGYTGRCRAYAPSIASSPAPGCPVHLCGCHLA